MPAAPKLAERDIVAQVRGYLESRGWRAIRHGRGIVQGFGGQVVQFGEPGMADYQFVYYRPERPALSFTLWVEFKRTGAKARCICRTKKPRQRCTACDQATWRERERARGALVWVADSLEMVMGEYERVFGWLHRGDAARGQLELGLGA